MSTPDRTTAPASAGAGAADDLDDAARPVIGLTTYLERAKSGVWEVPAAFLPQVYFDAVTRAGGIAVLLPPQPASQAIADRVVDGLDGLIITGGADLEASRYGQRAHAEADAPRHDRDEWETALLIAALTRDVPFLGICRGAQVLNVALGGTLHQHLPDRLGDRRYQLGDGVFSTARVDVEPSSQLAVLLDGTPELSVPVYHHQSIDRLGDGLTVSATTDEGVIEAVEAEGARFAVAVQWQPEEAPDDLRLFTGLVSAARSYRADLRADPRADAAGGPWE